MSLDKKILFMDAEEIIRQVAARIFPAIGYAVEIACEGSEAVEKYKTAAENGGKFDAVIMDFKVENGMGGVDAAKKILEYDADARIIVSSGALPSEIESDLRKYGFRASLPKPYSMQRAREVIDSVLK
jgi:CheY-like chemotaxis protein